MRLGNDRVHFNWVQDSIYSYRDGERTNEEAARKSVSSDRIVRIVVKGSSLPCGYSSSLDATCREWN